MATGLRSELENQPGSKGRAAFGGCNLARPMIAYVAAAQGASEVDT